MSQLPDIERAMLVFAHPDDADLSAGGTVAKWTRAGVEVSYVICTSGQRGSKDPAMTPSRLAEIREAEQLDVAQYLGVKKTIFLRHMDGELEATKAFRGEIAMLIRRYTPDVVVTHDPWMLYQLHPDHRAVGITTVDAVVAARDHLYLLDQAANGLPPHQPKELLLARAEKPDYVVDISDTVELKIEAVSRHHSQLDHVPGWRERVRELAASRGGAEGFAYAETYKRIQFR